MAETVGTFVSTIQGASSAIGLILLVAGVVSLGQRWRRANETQRRQLKWLLLVCLVGSLCLIVGLALAPWPMAAVALELVGLAAFGIGAPLVIGIAILKHRLFEIDHVFNRAVLYGLLTALVLGVYALLVGGSVALLRADQTQSRVAALVPALVLAAVFAQPVRRLAQRIAPVDVSPPNADHTKASPPRRWQACLGYGIGVPALIDAVLTAPLMLAEPFYNDPLLALARVAERAGLSHIAAVYTHLLTLLCYAVFAAAGMLVLSRRRFDNMAVLCASCMFTAPALFFAGGIEQDPNWTRVFGAQGIALASFNHVLRIIGMALFCLLLYLFPNGRLVSRWALPGFVLGLTLAGAALVVHVELQPATYPPHVSGDYVLDVLAPLLIVLVWGAAAQIMRYQRSENELERQQLKWVAAALSLQTMVLLVSGATHASDNGANPALFDAVAAIAFHAERLAQMLLPIALSIAVLRHHLWNAEPLLMRSLLYGGTMFLVVGLYAVLVGGMGALINQQELSPLFALLATGIVAAMFNPLRTRMQRGVNRLFYGMREEPYAVVEGWSAT